MQGVSAHPETASIGGLKRFCVIPEVNQFFEAVFSSLFVCSHLNSFQFASISTPSRQLPARLLRKSLTRRCPKDHFAFLHTTRILLTQRLSYRLHPSCPPH